MKVGPLVRCGQAAGVRATLAVAPTLVLSVPTAADAPAPKKHLGTRRSIYKDERLQPLVVSTGQQHGEPAGAGLQVSQILQLLYLKNIRWSKKAP